MIAEEEEMEGVEDEEADKSLEDDEAEVDHQYDHGTTTNARTTGYHGVLWTITDLI